MVMPDGKTAWRARWQTWDATFGVDTNSITLTAVEPRAAGQPNVQRPPVTQFFDSSTTAYYNSAIPLNSVKTAGSGLKIDITVSSPTAARIGSTFTSNRARSCKGKGGRRKPAPLLSAVSFVSTTR